MRGEHIELGRRLRSATLIAAVLALASPLLAARVGRGEGDLPIGVELLREAIRVRTVDGVDGERPLAQYLASRLTALGLEARVIPTPDPEGRGDRAALWARLPGAGLGRPVVLLSHLDGCTGAARSMPRASR